MQSLLYQSRTFAKHLPNPINLIFEVSKQITANKQVLPMVGKLKNVRLATEGHYYSKVNNLF